MAPRLVAGRANGFRKRRCTPYRRPSTVSAVSFESFRLTYTTFGLALPLNCARRLCTVMSVRTPQAGSADDGRTSLA